MRFPPLVYQYFCQLGKFYISSIYRVTIPPNLPEAVQAYASLPRENYHWKCFTFKCCKFSFKLSGHLRYITNL